MKNENKLITDNKSFVDELCKDIDISETPVWITNNEKHYKVYSIDKLKEKTNC